MNPALPSLAAVACLAPLAAADLSAVSAADTTGAEASAALPEATEPEAGSWRFSLTPYVWLAAQRGDVTVKGQTAAVDLDLSDTVDLIGDNFNGGFALHAEAGTGPLSIFGDGMYLDLETSKSGQAGTSRASYTQGFFELGAAYAVIGSPTGSPEGGASPTLEPLIGARIYHLDATISGPVGNVQASDEQTWIDGFVGARFMLPVSGPLSLFARGDVGAGGSDLAWNVLAGFNCDFGGTISLQAGYRWMDIEYAEGSGTDRFAYDVTLHGPFVGLSFRF